MSYQENVSFLQKYAANDLTASHLLPVPGTDGKINLLRNENPSASEEYGVEGLAPLTMMASQSSPASKYKDSGLFPLHMIDDPSNPLSEKYNPYDEKGSTMLKRMLQGLGIGGALGAAGGLGFAGLNGLNTSEGALGALKSQLTMENPLAAIMAAIGGGAGLLGGGLFASGEDISRELTYGPWVRDQWRDITPILQGKNRDMRFMATNAEKQMDPKAIKELQDGFTFIGPADGINRNGQPKWPPYFARSRSHVDFNGQDVSAEDVIDALEKRSSIINVGPDVTKKQNQTDDNIFWEGRDLVEPAHIREVAMVPEELDDDEGKWGDMLGVPIMTTGAGAALGGLATFLRSRIRATGPLSKEELLGSLALGGLTGAGAGAVVGAGYANDRRKYSDRHKEDLGGLAHLLNMSGLLASR